VNHARFVSRLLNRPQLIAPAAGAAVLAALMPGARLDGWDGDTSNDDREPREYAVCEGVAIIPVIGELVHRGGMMDALSGVCSYQGLGDMVSDALADPGVAALAFDIDSPGGEAAGCLDFAESLADQRGIKPMWAIINQSACSAAYAIASACDRILIGESAVAGSIGVCSYHTDLSQMLTSEGVKITFLYAGSHKIDGNPAQPLSDGARTEWQADIDQLYARFCGVVADNRGLSLDSVRGTEARTYLGQDAIRAGLADQISTFEDAIMALANRNAPEGARLNSPDTTPPASPTPPTGAPELTALQPVAVAREIPQTDPVAVAQACAAAGHPGLIAGLLEQHASMEQVQQRLTAATAITEAAVQMGMPTLGQKLIAQGVSLEGAREILFDAKAAADAGRPTDTARPATAPAAAEARTLNVGAIYATHNAPVRS
jgi:signal peptide peptidase SppA